MIDHALVGQLKRWAFLVRKRAFIGQRLAKVIEPF
jgi:hypothetical protein